MPTAELPMFFKNIMVKQASPPVIMLKICLPNSPGKEKENQFNIYLSLSISLTINENGKTPQARRREGKYISRK